MRVERERPALRFGQGLGREAVHLHVGQPLLGDDPLEATRILLHEEVAQEQRRLCKVEVPA